MFENFLDPIFRPLLRLGVLSTIIIISLLVSLLMVFIYKWMTDQHKMKQLKQDIKKFQKQMKQFRKDPAKMMEIQKKVTELNLTYMKESFKPTLVTFIPIILIFGWMNSALYFEPILPNQQFSVDVFVDKNLQGNVSVEVDNGLTVLDGLSKSVVGDKAVFSFKGIEGEHLMTFNFQNDSVQKKVLITDEQKYVSPVKKTNGKIRMISVRQKKLKVLFGLTWLWAYIIFAVVFSILLRKMLKVY